MAYIRAILTASLIFMVQPVFAEQSSRLTGVFYEVNNGEESLNFDEQSFYAMDDSCKIDKIKKLSRANTISI